MKLENKLLIPIAVYLVLLIVYTAMALYYNIGYNNAQFNAHMVQYDLGEGGSVCITPKGEKYHTCGHYTPDRNIPMSLKGARDLGLRPCKICRPIGIDALYKALDDIPMVFRHWLIVALLGSIFYWLIFLITLYQRKKS